MCLINLIMSCFVCLELICKIIAKKKVLKHVYVLSCILIVDIKRRLLVCRWFIILDAHVFSNVVKFVRLYLTFM